MLFNRRKPARIEGGALNTLIDQSVELTVNQGSILFRFEKSLRFDGTLNGTLQGTLKKDCVLVIGPKAVINGNVLAQGVVVLGTVRGNVSGEYVEIRESARVTGDITYVRVEIHQGSHVQGRMFRVEDGHKSEESGIASMDDAPS
ncbi:MAG: polymer-forming cytoskeletal protein [Betaproteobacteria bacterium]|jgi:cytoskeletal protein CcmA (bactofilin family)|nr:polymer-forming cytoskeletal protein [Betaproteobacteria bacterium]